MNPESPENFNRPENLSEQMVKVEARPAKDILDEMYNGEPDYGDYEMSGEELAAYPEEEKKVLPYAPFDPSLALRGIRKFSEEELSLPAAERRKIVRERLEKLKENIRQQSLGIASVIRELRKTVEVNPDITADELLAEVEESAPKHSLSEGQINLFKYALEDYEEKHKVVEKYRELYPKDEDLFEACFGRKPKGEVTVIKRPMTLHFQCHSSEDYALAYNFDKLKEDVGELTDEDKKKADLSGGAALRSVKIEDLKSVVTIENSHWNLKYEVVREDKTAEVHNSQFEIGIDAQKTDVEIEVKGQGKWKVKMVERDEWGFPARIQLLDLNDPDSAPLFDVTRAGPDWEGNRFFGVLKEINDPVTLNGNIIKDFKVKKADKVSYFGYINIDYSEIKISDRSPEGLIIKFQEDVALPPRIADEGRSNNIQIHEEQHQINKLFVPWEARLGRYRLMANVAEKAKTPEEAKGMVVRELLKEHRRDLFDRRTRDEMIAYYRDGRNTDDIFETLAHNLLYDYSEIFKEQIENLPSDIAEEVGKEMSEVIYQNDKDEEEGYSGYYVVDAVPLAVDPGMVKKFIDPIFKENYLHDLRMWVDSIATLEKKGYNRDEIISLLAQEPARNWNAVSRRFGRKE